MGRSDHMKKKSPELIDILHGNLKGTETVEKMEPRMWSLLEAAVVGVPTLGNDPTRPASRLGVMGVHVPSIAQASDLCANRTPLFWRQSPASNSGSNRGFALETSFSERRGHHKTTFTGFDETPISNTSSRRRMESPRSPKRRRILSSINPPGPDAEDDAPRRHTSDRAMTPPDIAADAAAPRGDNQDGAPEQGEQGEQEVPRGHGATAPKPTKFRFKSKSSRSSRHRREEGQGEGGEDADRHHDDRRRHRRYRSRSRSRDRDRDKDGARAKDRNPSRDRTRDRDRSEPKPQRRHHHRTHRTHRTRSRSPIHLPKEEEELPDGPPPLSPTTAFRESLFDALADDEGAAYWQSVYGQPIHIYDPPSHSNPNASPLDRMTDDEYASYVRQKMWEKTHAGLLEAQERRRQEKEREKEKREEGERVAREMERCLRRGEERRERRGWKARWEGYLARWRGWDAQQGGNEVEGIPWPWEGEKKREGEEVRAFFVKGIGLEEVGEREFAARLKEERVRWHPDKMQQRLGGKVEEAVMREVTAVFQVVDALWNDTRRNMGG